MSKSKNGSAVAIATPPAQANTQQPQDLFTLFQQFMAMQSSIKSETPAQPVTPAQPTKGAKKAAKVAKTEPETVKAIAGVHIYELENSFFVYGSDATAKLAEFFTRKPHLNKGFREREIKGLGKVNAYWFGQRQLKRIKNILKIA